MDTKCPYIRLGLGIFEIYFASALDFYYICSRFELYQVNAANVRF